jgi:UrcA family protein
MSSHTASSGRITRIVAAAIVAFAVGVPASSFAQAPLQDGSIPTVIVNYSDLNLATPQGSHALYQRLVGAAQQVCPKRSYASELSHNREAQRCVTAAVERAVKQVKSPQFAQVAATHMR